MELALLIPLLPLVGFLISGIFGSKLSGTTAGWISSFAVLGSFVLTLITFQQVNSTGAFTVKAFDWFNTGSFQVAFSFRIDELSTWMMMIVTGIGFLIHVYSIGYMHHDAGFARFFSYLNLFIFSMLLLVMGSNFLILFIGWEGVGLCSYLLIGFWYQNVNYGYAARKAFIMNRIGDLGLLLGIFLIWHFYGSLEYEVVFKTGTSIGETALTSIGLCLFVGAMGKSAQIPLFTWLPDAMAGPTPVSALIHAATMVTAGIYLVARCSVLFEGAPDAAQFILWIGLLTALIAGSIGLKQNDIKKVLAYSTVSQLGFMFVALGVGAYSTALFHVTTHAFFKALLFLGSGSVIHAMSGEQDIRRMGGLKKALPITHFTFLIGTVAISGIPPLAGFFSKDEILTKAFYGSGTLVFALLAVASLMTATYMFRLYFLTFHGKFRGTPEQEHHLHESPATMTVPLIILAILSIVGGFLGTPDWINHITHGGHFLSGYLDGVLHDHPFTAPSETFEFTLLGISLLILAVLIITLKNKYINKGDVPAEKESGIANMLQHKYWLDELYHQIIVNPISKISEYIYKLFDRPLVDGAIEGIAEGSKETGKLGRLLQTGLLDSYLLGMVAGIILILVYTLTR